MEECRQGGPAGSGAEPNAFRSRMEFAARRAGNATRLAEAAGISRRAIGDYLAGAAEPSRSRLVAIARAARVSVQWLATGEGSPTAVPGVIDGEVLEDALQTVEEYLGERRQTMAPFDKAGLVAILCGIEAAEDATVIEAQPRIARLLEMAASIG